MLASGLEFAKANWSRLCVSRSRGVFQAAQFLEAEVINKRIWDCVLLDRVVKIGRKFPVNGVSILWLDRAAVIVGGSRRRVLHISL